jgi:ribosomal protein L37AE/L43A
MTPLKRIERKLSRFAIPDLTTYLVAGQGLALLLSLVVPGLVDHLLLIPQAVLEGQWWRLLTFLFTPPFTHPILALFVLYFLWFMGGSLEAQWGAFRYNLYVLIGYIVTLAAAFVFPYGPATNAYITGSIFLAFAWLYPEFQILLFLILPVKVKWLALLTWLGFGYQLIFGGWATRLLILASIANFLLFFGRDLFHRARYGHRQLKRHATLVADRDKALHVCTVCGITDKTHPTMDFRYCSKCEPPVAYCAEHLRAHEHRRPG